MPSTMTYLYQTIEGHAVELAPRTKKVFPCFCLLLRLAVVDELVVDQVFLIRHGAVFIPIELGQISRLQFGFAIFHRVHG